MEIFRPKFFAFYSRSRTAAIVAGVALLASAAAVVRVRAAGRPTDVSHGGLLVVANSNDTLHRNGEGYLTLINPESAKIVGKIPDGGITAHEVLVSKDGRIAFAPIYGNANVGGVGTDGRTISVIDIQAAKQVGSIDFGRGVRPHFAVWGPDGMIYVTSEIEQSVSIVDPKTKTVVASIPTGKPESHNVAVSHDGRRAYTSNVNSGTVSVLDLKARKLVTVIQVAEGSYAAPLGDKDPRKDWKVQRIAVSPDDQTVFTCDWTTSQLVAIAASTNTVTGRAQLAAPCYGEAITADGKWALAPVIANQLAVVDVRQMKVVRTVEMPSPPQEVMIRPDGAEAYVSCHGPQGEKEKVVFVRISDWTVDHIVDTGYWPDGLAWSALNPESLHSAQ